MEDTMHLDGAAVSTTFEAAEEGIVRMLKSERRVKSKRQRCGQNHMQNRHSAGCSYARSGRPSRESTSTWLGVLESLPIGGTQLLPSQTAHKLCGMALWGAMSRGSKILWCSLAKIASTLGGSQLGPMVVKRHSKIASLTMRCYARRLLITSSVLGELSRKRIACRGTTRLPGL